MDTDLELLLETLVNTADKKGIAVAGYMWGFTEEDGKKEPIFVQFRNVKEEGDLLGYLFEKLHDLAEKKRAAGTVQEIRIKRPS